VLRIRLVLLWSRRPSLVVLFRMGSLLQWSRSICGCRRRLVSWQAKFKQLRLLPRLRETLIVSGLRRLPSMGTRSRACETVDPMIKDYLRTAPDADYIRLASFYLEGGPRSLWTSVYKAYKAAHGGAEPPNLGQFFRETLEANYGLRDLDQKF
jgi:hypothetical protein